MKNVSELTRHTWWNLLGFGIPMVAALFAIPSLIHGLGAERFGVLTIGWVIMGYFAMFDFGMGQATTKFVAANIARGEVQSLPTIVWSSFTGHLVLGMFGAGVCALLVPWLSGSAFNIRPELKTEVSDGFYVLAASIPLVIGGTCLRGVLEGARRFDLVNKVKIPAGIINYLAPLLVLQFTQNLLYIIGVILLSRGIVLCVYLLLCLRVLPLTAFRFHVQPNIIKPLLSFGGWVSVSSLTLPLITSLDRFVIGTVVSMTAVTYYATPYEMVTKLWILSGSLLSALFPVFSALAVDRPNEVRPLGTRAMKYLLASAAPVVAILFAFSSELLRLWIDSAFAGHATPVARWLAGGVLISVLAQVPFTILQGLGRADIPAKLQFMELPLYALATYYLAQTEGITGVAMAWTARVTVELVILLVIADKLLPDSTGRTGVLWLHSGAVFIITTLLASFWILGSGEVASLPLKLGIFVMLFAALAIAEWFVVLNISDRQLLLSQVIRTRINPNGPRQ